MSNSVLQNTQSSSFHENIISLTHHDDIIFNSDKISRFRRGGLLTVIKMIRRCRPAVSYF